MLGRKEIGEKDGGRCEEHYASNYLKVIRTFRKTIIKLKPDVALQIQA